MAWFHGERWDCWNHTCKADPGAPLEFQTGALRWEVLQATNTAQCPGEMSTGDEHRGAILCAAESTCAALTPAILWC